MAGMCKWCRWPVFAPLLIGLGLLAMIGGCNTVERDVRSSAGAVLGGGFDGVDIVDVSYRDVVLRGPSHLQDEAVDVVGDLRATRAVTYEETNAGAAPEENSTATTQAPSTTTAEVVAPTMNVTGSVADGAIVLTGTVPDETSKASVISAAIEAFGTENVTDELIVEGLTAGSELDSAAEGLAGLIPQFAGSMTDGTFRLVNATLSVGGTATSAEAAEQLRSAFDAAAGLTVEGSVESPTESAGAQIEADIAGLLALEGITFETGSAQVTEEGAAVLADVVAVLADAFAVDPNLRVEIGGHTDDRGGADSNLALGQARADAVLAYLTDAGIPAEGLTAVGYGESQPIADNATAEGRATNRRIEFTVTEG